jgi:hypothetical protein
LEDTPLIAFEISINGTKSCTAGIEGRGVVSVLVDRIWRVGPDEQEKLLLDAGGLISDTGQGAEFLKWLKEESLCLGDTITIRIVDVPATDEPIKRERENPKQREKSEREYYERMKKKYEK